MIDLDETGSSHDPSSTLPDPWRLPAETTAPQSLPRHWGLKPTDKPTNSTLVPFRVRYLECP